MTQSIFIQVGQCGNQIGHQFWDLALKEHAHINKNDIFDDAFNSFFRNVDDKSEQIGNIPSKIYSLKARAVMIDMEEGVVNAMLKSKLRNVFDHSQFITDVSGSGNNWAVGHHVYGPKYSEQILNTIRRSAEQCDYLQCFFILHSMGGGTGSGLGSYVLNLLRDEFPDVYRFVTAVYPSGDDDVITSPYNCVLAMKQLSEAADCVLPVENKALINITNKYNTTKKKEDVFEAMNSIVATMLLHLTSSSRFQGDMNVDLNEITMNMVPFPRMQYLMSAISPINDDNYNRKIDQSFTDVYSLSHQLTSCDPRAGTFLSAALLARGAVTLTDIRRNVDRFRDKFRFVSWNKDAWKTGHCSVAPVNQKYSLLSLSNNTALKTNLSSLYSKFSLLYKRKAHLHHYLSVSDMERDYFDASIQSLDELICEYDHVDSNVTQANIPRMQIIR